MPMIPAPFTFENFDKFALRSFAENLLRFLSTEHRFVEAALVVSLEAPFGSGKSTFFSMFSHMVESVQIESKPFELVVRLNAWESDFGEDPVLAIVSGITDAISATEVDVNERALTKMKSAAGVAGRFLTSIGNDLITEKLGVDLLKATEHAKGEVGLNPDPGLAIFRIYQARKKAIDDLKQAVVSLVEGSGMRLLLLVDELDRCRPAYAIDYLESLKHLFDCPSFTIVLGVDSRQMASSLRSLFGVDLNFNEYFRKFAHRRISLPSLDERNSLSFCQGLIDKYFEEDVSGNRYFASFNRERIDNVSNMFISLGLSARQSHEAMRVSSHCLRVDESNRGKMLWGWHVVTVFMAALSIANREDFIALGRRSMSIARLCEIAESLDMVTGRKAKWWKFLLLAAYLGVEKEADLNGIKREGGVVSEEDKDRLDAFAHEAFQRWGWSTDTPTKTIFAKIEALESFVGSTTSS